MRILSPTTIFISKPYRFRRLLLWNSTAVCLTDKIPTGEVETYQSYKMHWNCLDFGIRKYYRKISRTYNSKLNLPPFCRLGSASLRRRRLSFFRSVPGYSCTRAGRRKPKIRYPSDFGSASVYGKDAIVGFLSDSALKQKRYSGVVGASIDDFMRGQNLRKKWLGMHTSK